MNDNNSNQLLSNWKRIFQITTSDYLKKELESIDFSLLTDAKQNILHFACIEGKKDLITLLLELDPQNGKLNINQQDSIQDWSPLFYVIDSCDNGLPDIVEILIKNGAQVNIGDSKGITPLHLACFKGQDDNVEYLIRQKALVNCADALGRRPLTYAIIEGQTNCVQTLIEAGADINVTDINKETLLHYAVIGKGNGLFYSTILIEKGIDVNIKNKEGNSALMLCAKRNPKENVRLIQLLLNSNASIDVVNSKGETFYSILGHEAINNQFTSEEGNDSQNKKTNGSILKYKDRIVFFILLPLITIWLSNKLLKIINSH